MWMTACCSAVKIDGGETRAERLGRDMWATVGERGEGVSMRQQVCIHCARWLARLWNPCRAVQQLARLPRLASLNLGWNLKLSAAALASFATSGTPLTQLDLSFCGEMGDEALGMLGVLPKLKALCLRKCTRVGDAVSRRRWY